MQCVLICAYFRPDSTSAEIIDTINHCLNVMAKEDAVILAGDLNCHTDVEMKKTTEVMSYLEGEGLTLINNKKLKTYICHNGTITINLVFINSKFKPVKQEVIWKRKGNIYQ
jgi:calcineurin-like phosphoesterase family protein